MTLVLDLAGVYYTLINPWAYRRNHMELGEFSEPLIEGLGTRLVTGAK